MLRSRYWFVLVVATLAGCGGVDKPQMAQVSGTVSLDGKPLESGMIVFTPAKGRAGVGKIQGGQIVDVSTFEPKDGVPVGRLTLSVSDAPSLTMEETKEKIVPSKYNSTETSELTAAIYAGKPNTITIELTTPSVNEPASDPTEAPSK